MFYIVNARGEVVGTASGPTNAEHLAARGLRVIASDLEVAPENVTVAGSSDQLRIIERPKQVHPRLVIATDATDEDGDGLPEIEANGRSTASIEVTTRTAAGEPMTDEVAVTFRTTAGRLSARTVTTKKGTAAVRLTSTRETVLAQVTATAPGFAPARIQLEFVP